MLGITVDEYGVLSENKRLTLVHEASKGNFEGDTWYDVVHPEEAKSLVLYGSDYMSGKPAVTVNQYGQGQAYYLGTGISPELLAVLMQDIYQSQYIRPILPCQIDSVEIVRRTKGQADLFFIINHNPAPVLFDLGATYTNALTDDTISGTVEIKANGELILQSITAPA